MEQIWGRGGTKGWDRGRGPPGEGAHVVGDAKLFGREPECASIVPDEAGCKKEDANGAIVRV